MVFLFSLLSPSCLFCSFFFLFTYLYLSYLPKISINSETLSFYSVKYYICSNLQTLGKASCYEIPRGNDCKGYLFPVQVVCDFPSTTESVESLQDVTYRILGYLWSWETHFIYLLKPMPIRIFFHHTAPNFDFLNFFKTSVLKQ